MTNTYDPYNRYASSENISLGEFIVEDWKPELVKANHPALRKKATVDPFGSSVDWVEREKQMIQLMHDKLGVGLAAPQTGSSYNMFVMTHSVLGDIGVYKPEILERSETSVTMEEGCLSFPMLYIPVSRPEKIKVRYTKTDGTKLVEMWMDGMDARCFQHEYDHLMGVCHIELVSDFKLRRAMAARDKRLKKAERALRKR